MAYFNGKKILAAVQSVPTSATAETTTYDNTTSGLIADNVQDAIDETLTINEQNKKEIKSDLTDLKEALYGYVLDTAPVDIEDIIPSTTTINSTTYNLVDNVRGLVKSVNGNTVKSETELKSVEYEGLVVKGANLLNEQTLIKGGMCSSDGNFGISTNNYYSMPLNNFINVVGGKTMYVNALIKDNLTINSLWCTWDKNGNFISRVGNNLINGKAMYKLPDNAVKLYLYFWISDTTIDLSTKISNIILSNVDTPYKPYKEPQTLLQYPTTLRGVGTAKDKLVITENENGLYTATKISNVGSVDLATLSFTFDSVSTKQWWNVNIPNLKTGTSNILHENLITYSYSTFVSDINIIGLASVSSITNRVIIRNNSTIDTPTGKLVYELANPTSEVLSTTLTESQVMPLIELGGSIEANGGSTTMEMVYKLINTTTTSEVLDNE